MLGEGVTYQVGRNGLHFLFQEFSFHLMKVFYENQKPKEDLVVKNRVFN